jgi:hypothetical protein
VPSGAFVHPVVLVAGLQLWHPFDDAFGVPPA